MRILIQAHGKAPAPHLNSCSGEGPPKPFVEELGGEVVRRARVSAAAPGRAARSVERPDIKAASIGRRFPR